MKIVLKIRPVRLIPGGGGISTGFFLAAITGSLPGQIAHSAKQHCKKIAFVTTEGKASSARIHRNLMIRFRFKSRALHGSIASVLSLSRLGGRGIAVTRAMIVTALLLGWGFFGSAEAAETRPSGKADAQSCFVQVLHSEEIPLGPMFHHTVRATLLVTPSDGPPFQTTIEKVTPWQVPPPRQGQRAWVYCDPASLKAFAFY